MIKVLRIINRLNLGGPTYNASYLTKYLEPDFKTLLVAGMKDETEASSLFIPESLGIKPVFVNNMYRAIHPVNDYKAYKEIVSIIRDFKPDIVHTHAAKAGALGRLAAKNCGVPIILHTFHGHVFHSYFNPLKTRFFLSVERFLAKHSSKIIAISEKQLDELSNVFRIAPKEQFSVIPLGFDLGRFSENQEEKRASFREKYNVDNDTIALGIIGRFVPIKNHALFLKALAALKEKTQKKFRAFFIGDGELRADIEKMASELNLSFDLSDVRADTDITFTSWIKQIDWANAGLDVVVLTSLNEGTPVSLIEAQAASRPIISTRVGGIEDVVSEGKSALLSPNNDVNALVENLVKIIENDALRRQLSLSGKEYVMNTYSHHILSENMKKLYYELIRKRQEVV